MQTIPLDVLADTLKDVNNSSLKGLCNVMMNIDCVKLIHKIAVLRHGEKWLKQEKTFPKSRNSDDIMRYLTAFEITDFMLDKYRFHEMMIFGQNKTAKFSIMCFQNDLFNNPEPMVEVTLDVSYAKNTHSVKRQLEDIFGARLKWYDMPTKARHTGWGNFIVTGLDMVTEEIMHLLSSVYNIGNNKTTFWIKKQLFLGFVLEILKDYDYMITVFYEDARSKKATVIVPDTERLGKLCKNYACKMIHEYVCTGCESVTYCSPECQKQHWEVHKGECERN